MARNTKRLFRAFTTKSSRGEKWRKSTTHSVTRVARVPHGPGAPKLIKWRFSSAHRRRFGSFPHVTTNTTGQLAVHMEGHGEEGGGTQGCKVEEFRGGRWRNPGEEGGGTPGSKVEVTQERHETTRETQWGARWRNSREEGGAAPGVQGGGPQGARWRNSGEQGGGQREHHETTRETQWGDFCKAVRELTHRSGIEAMANERTRGERLRRRPGQTWR